MASKGLVLFTAFAASAAIGSYLYIKKKNLSLALKNAPDPSGGVIGDFGTSIATVTDFPLEQGSQGAAVIELQKALGLSAADQDGDFGPQTEAALENATGMTKVKDQSAFDKIVKKQTTSNGNSARHSLAEKLLSSAMAQKTETGNYQFEANKNLQVYKCDKVLNMFINTHQRLTGNEYDYMAFTKYGNVRIVQVDAQGFIVMYDAGMGKYFYTSPYDWNLV